MTYRMVKTKLLESGKAPVERQRFVQIVTRLVKEMNGIKDTDTHSGRVEHKRWVDALEAATK